MRLTRRSALTTFATSTAGLALVGLTGCAGTDKPLLAQNLTRMARDIFPHANVPDSVYAGIIDGMMKAADATQIKALDEGMALLTGTDAIPWHSRPEQARIASLRAIETTPFFIGVRIATLFALYGNPVIVKTFGYPGPSVEFGGYVNAGFNDLKWLPEPRS
jgi:hypothetical protein